MSETHKTIKIWICRTSLLIAIIIIIKHSSLILHDSASVVHHIVVIINMLPQEMSLLTILIQQFMMTREIWFIILGVIIFNLGFKRALHTYNPLFVVGVLIHNDWTDVIQQRHYMRIRIERHLDMYTPLLLWVPTSRWKMKMWNNLKLEKIWLFWGKIVIFYTKYPKNFRASLRSARFF